MQRPESVEPRNELNTVAAQNKGVSANLDSLVWRLKFDEDWWSNTYPRRFPSPETAVR